MLTKNRVAFRIILTYNKSRSTLVTFREFSFCNIQVYSLIRTIQPPFRLGQCWQDLEVGGPDILNLLVFPHHQMHISSSLWNSTIIRNSLLVDGSNETNFDHLWTSHTARDPNSWGLNNRDSATISGLIWDDFQWHITGLSSLKGNP